MAKDSMYLYGKNSVSERLKAGPSSIKRIFVEEGFDSPHIMNMIKAKGISLERVSEKELMRVKCADRLQGIVAEVGRFRYVEFDELLAKGKEKNLSFICLDSISDPHNLGSIIRIAACFGGFAVVLPGHASCEVNDTVMHVASGGENFVPVAMVNNLSTALAKAKKAGYWIVGTAVEGGRDINRAEFPFPLCLVLGSEGKGIRHGLKGSLEMNVSLPMRGAKLSLNVAMACAIFCHEIARQKSSETGEHHG